MLLLSGFTYYSPPSYPHSFLPIAYTKPLDVSNNVCWSPHATFDMNEDW